MCCGAQPRSPNVPTPPRTPPPLPKTPSRAVSPPPRRLPPPIIVVPKQRQIVPNTSIGDKVCKICGWPIRDLKYIDPSTRKTVQTRCCSNNKCPNHLIKK